MRRLARVIAVLRAAGADWSCPELSAGPAPIERSSTQYACVEVHPARPQSLCRVREGSGTSLLVSAIRARRSPDHQEWKGKPEVDTSGARVGAAQLLKSSSRRSISSRRGLSPPPSASPSPSAEGQGRVLDGTALEPRAPRITQAHQRRRRAQVRTHLPIPSHGRGRPVRAHALSPSTRPTKYLSLYGEGERLGVADPSPATRVGIPPPAARRAGPAPSGEFAAGFAVPSTWLEEKPAGFDINCRPKYAFVTPGAQPILARA
jgi:hypothetical protein